MKASQETREFASSILREMLPILDEKQRRMLSGVVASNLGYGGISFVNSITGQSRNTISSDAGDTHLTKDHPEGKSPDAKEICLTNSGRLRRPGGGRKPIENKYPDLQEKIEEIISDDTYGNPEKPLKYTSKSLRNIADTLAENEIIICHTLVGKILERMGYSKQQNQKMKQIGSHEYSAPERAPRPAELSSETGGVEQRDRRR